MKNVCIIFLLSIIISLSAFGLAESENKGGMSSTTGYNSAFCEEFLRIHVRADSNDEQAQAVKYKVRDCVVEYLTPLVAEYRTKAEAVAGLQSCLPKIASLATALLHREGFDYGATVSLTEEDFPTRVYDGYTLPAGRYTSLILRLGRGEGDNWWCVVYPPLCFAAVDTNVVYKSKILEIIEKWQGQVFDDEEEMGEIYPKNSA